MFSPAPMLHLSVLVLLRDERTVLRVLGELGVVELTRTPAGAATAPLAPRECGGEIARCDRLQARIEALRQLLEMAPAPTSAAPAAELTLDEAEAQLQALEQRAAELAGHRQRLRAHSGELTSLCERLSNYTGLDIPLAGEDQFSFLHFVIGSLPAENFERLQSEAGLGSALVPLAERNGRRPLLIMTTRRARPSLDAALARAGFEREQFPITEPETVDLKAAKSDQQKEAAEAERLQVDAQVRGLASEVATPLAGIEAWAGLERSLLQAEQNFPHTAAAVLLTGWTAAEDAPLLQQRLRDLVGDRCVVETASPDDLPEEQIPVLLRHRRFFRPFQMLVTAYGLPRYHELEPTLFVALSYLLMFGMMFGDAGHGSVLAALGLYLRHRSRAPTTRDAGWLLLCGGLSSMVFGVVYGSYFGIAACKKYALWHDPLEGDPMGLMYTAIGLGIVMISLGLVLNIINRFRRGDVLGALLDKFGLMGVLFYWGALFLLAQYAALESRGLVSAAIVVFLALPIVGWALKEPLEYFLRRRSGHAAESHASLGAALTESLVGAFEAVLSYLANTISFVRLAAYAMSHAALLVAAFMLAAEVKKLPFAGDALNLLVIILGNLVAILLEGIIASVQALRLEYYEFFGKFFSGSGQAFKPFRLSSAGRSPA